MIKYIIKNTIADYKNSFKSSFLSYSWIVIHPLLLLVIYSFVFSTILESKIGINNDVSYSIYLSVAILPWIVFSNTLLQGTLSISKNIYLIKKLNVPLYVYVAKEVLEQFLNMIIVLILLMCFLLLNKVEVSFSWFLIIIPIACLFVFSLGLSMLLSSINVFFRDIEKAIGIFLQMMMWLIPIVYPLNIVPITFQWVIIYNPLYYYFDSLREILIFNNGIDSIHSFVMISSSLFILILGLYTIKKLESDIRDSI